MQIKKHLISIAVVLNIILIMNPANAGAANCIGNNFEQQVPPVPDVQLPSVSIDAPDSVNSGETITLTANAVTDTENGAKPFFFWCVQGGAEPQADSASADFSTIKLTAPVLETGGVVRVSVQVGDDLGYVDIDTIYIDVLAGQAEDSDNDGFPDAWEMEHFGNLDQDADTDFDGDGIPDGDEYKYGFDPKTDDADLDTDKDGIPDIEEYYSGTDPNDPNDPPCDPDDDGDDDDDNDTGKPGKVTICHKGKTITISKAALQAHLNHGDTEGACGSTTPAPQCDHSWMRVEAGPEADIEIYDSDNNPITEKDYGKPGIRFEKDEHGNTIIILTGIADGDYRIVLHGKKNGKCRLKIKGSRGDSGIHRLDREVDVEKHKSKKCKIKVDALTDEFVSEEVSVSQKPDNTPLHFDFDGDDDVDVFDIMKVSIRWDKSAGDGVYDEFFDFDEDNYIGIFDIMKVVNTWFVPEESE